MRKKEIKKWWVIWIRPFDRLPATQDLSKVSGFLLF